MQSVSLPDLVVSFLPPILISKNDQKYVAFEGKWFPVNESFTLDDAKRHWKRWDSGIVDKAPVTQEKSWEVANSKGNGFYTVKYNKTSWSCNCAGFGFRRQCRHIDQIKKQVV